MARKINGKVVTRYIWQDQLRIAAELDPTGKIRQQYVYSDGVNSPDYMVYQGRKYLFVKDHRGSINLVVDAVSGEIKQRMMYSEFGEVTEDTNPGFQPFGFAGGLYDPETKLVRFGARDYDSRIGRWLSKDPIRFEGGDTNLYGYVVNDPINKSDYNGRHPVALAAVGVGAATGAVVGLVTSFVTSNSCTLGGKFEDAGKGFIYGAIGGAVAGLGAVGGGVVGGAVTVIGSIFAGAGAALVEIFGP